MNQFLNWSCVRWQHDIEAEAALGPPVTDPWFGGTDIVLSAGYGNVSGDSRNTVYFPR